MRGTVVIIGAVIWLLAVFGAYYQYDVSGVWWENVILFAAMQSIGTVLMTKGGFSRK